MFPVRPGQQNFLSGTMGELRSSHFHAGLDIKTSGVQGLEVYASATGYVSRIKISEGGYGNAIYMAHPNGTTTVYAHLKSFQEDIADYVRRAQYQQQSFTIELFPEKNQFALQKGDLLGYSGNSGSSGGPHLHFEIRDSRQRPLNPLKQKFSEIKDNIAPEVRKVVLRTMNAGSRINDQYGRFEFTAIRKGNHYSLPGLITAYGSIGVELLAHDRLNGANNRNGVPCIELLLNGQQQFQQNIERFTFAETRGILVHTDYETARRKQQRFAKLYRDDGNTLPFYKTNDNKGIVNISADSNYQVQINLWDIENNSSQVIFDISGKQPTKDLNKKSYSPPQGLRYQLMGNNLVVYTPSSQKSDACVYLYANRLQYEVLPDYQINGAGVIIWDLDRGLPDSLQFQDQSLAFDFKAVIPGGREFNYFGEHLNLYASGSALYDTVFLSTSYQQDREKHMEIFSISEDLYPLRKNLSVTLKPQLAYAEKSKSAVYTVDAKGQTSYVGGNWKGDHMEFKTRNWGKYTILTDSVKPQIKAARINADNLAFVVKDPMSGIDNYRLEIDGKWVLMNYDYKRNLLWSEKLDSSVPFKGRLQLKVVDNMGNISYYKANL